MECLIRVIGMKKSLPASRGEVLADVLLRAGIPINLYCSGKGLCGRCCVEVVEGDLMPPDVSEKALLERRGLPENFRLACSSRISGDVSIAIPETSLPQRIRVLSSGIVPPFRIHPAVKKFALHLPKPDLSSPKAPLDAVARMFPAKRPFLSLGLVRKMGQRAGASGFRGTAVVYRETELLDIEPAHTESSNYGLAVDIGTTTVVVELVDLDSGDSIGLSTFLNPQVRYGHDVVSRISHAFRNRENLKALTRLIREALATATKNLLRAHRISSKHVYDVAVVGNTAMNHLFLGISVDTLAQSPFHPVFSVLPEIPARDLGFPIHPSAKAYVAPNVQGFVGGDVAAGLMALDLTGKKGRFLYLDLGTNGEIVLKKGRTLIATSTAAGPAFEGMNIRCGMLAQPGAIWKAEFDGKLRVQTIHEEPPRGICGTGLIDVLAVFLEKGDIDPSGRIVTSRGKIPIARGLSLGQEDVRQLQLACAAIRTGTGMLLEEQKLTPEDLDGIYVAGAFGFDLDVRNAIRIGLLPQVSEERICFLGNAALAGAKKLLLSAPSREAVEAQARRARFVSLASRAAFQKRFIEALVFPSSR